MMALLSVAGPSDAPAEPSPSLSGCLKKGRGGPRVGVSDAGLYNASADNGMSDSV